MKYKLSMVVAAWLTGTLAPHGADAQPDDANTLSRQVGQLLISGRGTEARGQTDTFADILGMDGTAMFVAVARDAARNLQDAGDTAAAISALNEAVRLHPQAPELRYARASTHLHARDTASAEADLLAVEDVAKDNPVLSAEVCVQRVLLNLDPDHGLALCDAAIAAAPDARTIALKGVALIHQHKPDQALSYFQQALTLQPQNPVALYGRGYIAMTAHDHHDGHDHKDGEADIAAANLLDPDVGLRFPLLLEVH